jgi:hypothetical protein
MMLLPTWNKRRRAGQFVNPTRLLKEHWDEYKRQKAQAADSLAAGELEQSFYP